MLIGWLRRHFARPRDISEWTMATGSKGGFPVVIRSRVYPLHGTSSKDFPETIEIVCAGNRYPLKLSPLVAHE